MADEKTVATVDLGAANTGEVAAAKAADDTESQEASSAPVKETPILDEGGDLTSTVEFTAATEEDDSSGSDENDQDSQGKEKDGKTGKGADDEEGETDKGAPENKDDTFQQHPRFQELMNDKSRMQGQIETLTAQVNALTAGKPTKETPESTDADYENVMSMTDEALIENFEKDPKGFLANFGRQIYSEVLDKVREENTAKETQATVKSQEQEIRDMYSKYETDNPDFTEMWNKGEIQAFQKANPGHTPISAHQVIVANKKVADAEAAKTSAVEAAVKEAKDAAKKAQQTKTHAKVISGGPANGAVTSQSGVPAELTDTKKHGGLIRALTNRSLARTKQ
jgi:hypothetical protein